MRPLKMTLSAGGVENIFGETLKIKVRESSQDLLIKTDNDTIPCRAGDLIVLPSKVVSFTIENMGDADSDVELLLMGANGATLESSAGAVEVINLFEVQKVDVQDWPSTFVSKLLSSGRLKSGGGFVLPADGAVDFGSHDVYGSVRIHVSGPCRISLVASASNNYGTEIYEAGVLTLAINSKFYVSTSEVGGVSVKFISVGDQ